MESLNEGRQEMALVTEEIRIKIALLSHAPRNVDVILEPGEKVKIYQETDRKYIRPFPVSPVDGQQVFVLQNNVEKKSGLHEVIWID